MLGAVRKLLVPQNLQALGLALLGIAGVVIVLVLAVILIVRLLVLGYPATCGQTILPPHKCEVPLAVEGYVVSNVVFKTWDQKQALHGKPEVYESTDELIQKKRDADFCFLTRITGKFNGAGEYVEVYRRDDEDWYLRAKSHVGGVGVTVGCVKLALQATSDGN